MVRPVRLDVSEAQRLIVVALVTYYLLQSVDLSTFTICISKNSDSITQCLSTQPCAERRNNVIGDAQEPGGDMCTDALT